eukprot:m.1582379 g.1582379  ORF g.1582379 m.1582379 type:complete len:67 (-) comp25317_c1_seq1:159-359(-)
MSKTTWKVAGSDGTYYSNNASQWINCHCCNIFSSERLENLLDLTTKRCENGNIILLQGTHLVKKYD